MTIMTNRNVFLKNIFKFSGVYLTIVPTYIGGYMALTWASKQTDMAKNRNINKKLDTKYYTREIHKSSFILPNWIKKILITN